MIRFVFALVLLGLVAGEARAGLITYTETVTGSGSLGGTAFTDAVVTFTGIGDTANIQPVGSVAAKLSLDSFSVNVSGVGGADFTTPFLIVSAFSIHSVKFAQNPGFSIFGVISSDLVDYDLSTPIGPLSGSPQGFTLGINYSTSVGDFFFNPGSTFSNASFQAGPSSAVPEPSSLVMSLTATAFGLFAARWRHNLQARQATEKTW